MRYPILIARISDATTYLRKKCRYIYQRICSAAIANNVGHSIRVVYVATLKAGRGVEIDTFHFISRLGYCIFFA